jgi:hypothetical protein
MSNFYPNADQAEYMRGLGKIPAEEKCYCGWFRLGECNSCDKSKTHAVRVAEKRRLEAWAEEHNEALGHTSVSNGYVVWCKECNPDFPRGMVVQSLREWKD